MKKSINLALLILPLLAGVSCEKSTSGRSYGEGSVIFNCQTQSFIGEVTRSTYELPADLIPPTQDFTLELSGEYNDPDSGEPIEYSESYANVKEYHVNIPMLVTGDYHASISYGDKSLESATNACFEGSKDFKVVARKESQENLTASLSNSAIRLNTTEWFNKYYSYAIFTITTSQGNSFDFAPNEGELIFVEAGSTLTLSGSATKSQTGTTVKFPANVIGSTKQGLLNTIVIDASQAGGASLNVTFDQTTSEINLEIELNPES